MVNTAASKSAFSAFQKVIYSFLAAVLCGIMWRTRGENGWGSSWGLLTVGLVFTMYIYSVFGKRGNSSMFHIAATAVSFMLTVPAWGSLLYQIQGFIQSDTEPEMTVPVSPFGGVFMMLVLGFGIPTLFAFFLSRLFSGRKYKLYHYIIVLAVFYAVMYLSRATLAHYVLNLVQPQSAKAFEASLAELGIQSSAHSAYLQHFSSIAWAKHIPYGRVYFTEISTLSFAFSALAVWLTVRFGFKDKTGGRIILVSCLAFAFAITLADLFFWGEGKSDSFIFRYTWVLWEYFTGFIAGGIIMAYLFAADKKSQPAEGDKPFGFAPKKLCDAVEFLFIYGFALCVTLIRPVAERLKHNDTLMIAAYAVLGVAAVVIGIIMLAGKLPKIWKSDAVLFSRKGILIYPAAYILMYQLIGSGDSPANITDFSGLINIILYLSYVIFFGGYLLLRKRKEAQLPG